MITTHYIKLYYIIKNEKKVWYDDIMIVPSGYPILTKFFRLGETLPSYNVKKEDHES